MLRKSDNMQRFRSRRNKIFLGIFIFRAFSKSDIQYLWQGEVSVCKVLVPNKLLVKTDYLLHQKFELHRKQMNGFCIRIVFTEKNLAHILVC